MGSMPVGRVAGGVAGEVAGRAEGAAEDGTARANAATSMSISARRLDEERTRFPRCSRRSALSLRSVSPRESSSDRIFSNRRSSSRWS